MPSERAMLKHVRPLWHEEPEHAELTPFLEEIKELCLDYAKRIVESQKRTPQQARYIKNLPDQGPTKIGTGVRQIRDGELQ